jgi:gliding motility-associated-like protein
MAAPKLTLPFVSIVLCLLLSFIKTTAQVSCVPVYVQEITGQSNLETRDIRQLADGTALIVGRTKDPTGYYGFVLRTAADGAVLWSVRIGTPGDELTGVCPLSNGNFLLYGFTRYNFAPGKTWLTCIDNNGTVVWGYQLFDNNTGTLTADRPKAVTQFSDGDIVGTFNVNDSTASSDAIVFKMGLDGTVRWMRRFDNGKDDSFTSLAFNGNTIYAAGFSTTTAKRGVIVQLNSSDGALLSSKNIYHNDLTFQEEVTRIEIFNNIISYGLLIRKADPIFTTNQLLLTQTDVQGNLRYTIDAGNIGGTVKITVRRTADEGFFLLHESNNAYGGPTVIKLNRYGKCDWGRVLATTYYDQVSNGIAITPDGGCITAGYYDHYGISILNRVQLVRINAAGITGSCLSTTATRYTDLGSLKEQAFSWATVSDAVAARGTMSLNSQLYAATGNKVCETTICTDITPLPPDCNKTYRIEYAGNKRTLFRDAVTTSDGGRVAVGSQLDDGLVVKFDVSGDIAWSKSLSETLHGLTIMRIIRMQDNNLLLFATNDKVENHYGSRYITLIKMDNSGNIIWSRDVDYFNTHFYQDVVDVANVPDGGLIMMANDNYGSGATYSYVIRFDASLNIIWKKQLTHNAAAPLYRSITCSGNAVLLAYDSYDYYNSNKFGVDKLDLATGNKIWTNRYETSGSNVERINRIFSVNDTAYVFINHFAPVSPFISVQSTLMVKIDPTGKVNNALALSSGAIIPVQGYEHLDVSPPSVTLTTDNDFVLAQRVITTPDTVLNISRLRRDGSTVWSVNHPAMKYYSIFNIHQQANGYILLGTALAPRQNDPLFTHGFMLKVDSVGEIVHPNVGACSSVTGTLNASPIAVSLSWNAIDAVIDLTPVTLLPGNIISMDIPMDATLFCSERANCSQVTLGQRGNGCSVSDTLVYFLQNATNCGAVATWQYDATFFKPGLVSSDTLRLIPLRTGASTVKADMEGHCFLDTKIIQASILVAAANMRLGADTVICEGGGIKLRAGPGYTSYTWNNNTTDSVLVVNAPGKYYVDVTDNCGGSGTDTILVNRAGASFSVKAPTASKCNNDPVQLEAGSGFLNYQWSTQAGNQAQGIKVSVNPAATTKYYVQAEKWPGCFVKDSILVNVLHSPPVGLQAATAICIGDSLQLDAGPLFDSYTWSTGDITQKLMVKNKGWYKVTATYSNGCQSRDSFELSLNNNPVPVLDKTPLLCKDATRDLSPGQFNTYLWNDGSIGPSLPVSAIGTYWVKVTDQNGCKGFDTVKITAIAPLPADFLGTEMELCQYGQLKIVPAGSFKNYNWSDQSTGATLTISKPGTYWLQATDQNNCTGTDTIKVIQKECLIGLYMPNAFSPNGDNRNDLITPMLYGNAKYIHFTIYNRWGQKVYETHTLKQGWDGRINGVLAVPGTYIWQCRYILEGQPERFEKGIVQLIR